MAMKLSTGKVAFPIEFDNGDKGVIYFNPNDREFLDRVMNFESSIEERIKQINIEKYKSQIEDGIKIDVDLKNIDALKKMTNEERQSLKNKTKAILSIDADYQKALKDELNDIFKSDVSSVVFKYCQPLDNVLIENEKGEEESDIFIMQFVRAFAEEIKKYNERVSPAMEKHIGKYNK